MSRLTRDLAGLDHLTGAVNALIAPTIDKNFATCALLHYDAVRHVVDLGNSGDTLSGSVKIELEVQHSDDDSTWVACADTDITGAVAGTNTGTYAVIDAPAEDSAIFTTEYIGGKAYTRTVLNVTGTHTNGTPISVQYIRYRKDVL